MAKDLVLQLRYLGMLPQIGHREYRFQIEARDKSVRTVALTIDDGIFRTNRLMFQEAPDLCYQKMLADVVNEADGLPISGRAQVSEAEVVSYRNAHPIGKLRKSAFRPREL
jgi:hypothetical protein